MFRVYSKKNCPDCNRAKSILENEEVPFEVIMVDEDEKAFAFLQAEGHKALPQIYYKDNLFIKGGITGLVKEFKDGNLENLLK